MAACKHPHRLSEIPPFLGGRLSPPSWNHIAALKPLQKSSFAEIFGELLLKEHQQQPDTGAHTIDVGTHINVHERQTLAEESFYPSSAFSSSAPSLCDSSYSSSSSDTEADVDAFDNINSVCHVSRHVRSRSQVARAAAAASFPPPVSCIGRSGKPWFMFKSYRENGRFILKEVRIPTQEFMQSCRKDGRLKLHIIQSDDEIPDEDEDDEYDYDEEDDTEEEDAAEEEY